MVDKGESPDLMPPELSDAYHRGRRSYGFFSGLLIAWELIGVEINEAPFKDFDVLLKSPQAAPYVLIALVLYFAFRTTIEWKQSDQARRGLRASRVDFGVAHLLGVVAIALYGLQRLLEVQIADFFGLNYNLTGVLGMMPGMFFGILVVIWIDDRKRGIGVFDFIKNHWVLLVITLGFFTFPLAIFVQRPSEGGMAQLSLYFFGVLLGVAVFLGMIIGPPFVLSRLRQKTDAE